jgi:hypothetical protein
MITFVKRKERRKTCFRPGKMEQRDDIIAEDGRINLEESIVDEYIVSRLEIFWLCKYDDAVCVEIVSSWSDLTKSH